MALEDYNYVLCSHNIEESLLHLFLACPFAAQYWNTLRLQTGGSIDPFDILDSFRRQLAVHFFLEMLLCMSQAIWSVRMAMTISSGIDMFLFGDASKFSRMSLQDLFSGQSKHFGLHLVHGQTIMCNSAYFLFVFPCFVNLCTGNLLSIFCLINPSKGHTPSVFLKKKSERG